MMITVANIAYRLPFRLEAERLQAELEQFSIEDWQRFPEGLPLIAVGGQLSYEYPIGSYLKPTVFLTHSPTLSDYLSRLNVVLSRTRLVRLCSGQHYAYEGCQNYHHYAHRSLLIPFDQTQDCDFQVEDKPLAFTSGNAYFLDPNQTYKIGYQGNDRVQFLIIETPIDAALPIWLKNEWLKDEQLKDECLKKDEETFSSDPVNNNSSKHSFPRLSIVPYRFRVLNPVELDNLLTPLTAELTQTIPDNDRRKEILFQHIDFFSDQWRMAFDEFGYSPLGELTYRDLILFFKEQIITKSTPWLNPNKLGQRSLKIISSVLLPENTGLRQFSHRVMAKRHEPNGTDWSTLRNEDLPQFERPVFIVSAPRAGSTLLFETLSRFQEFWSIGKESHDLMEGMPELHPSSLDYHSNRLTDSIVTDPLSTTLKKRFLAQLRNHAGVFYLSLESSQQPNPLRLLEKTPKNALRIPFLKAVFPEAHFIFLYRDPAENISSMLEGWRLRRFVSYRGLPGWPYKEWSFLLVPGWSDLKYCSLAEIVAHQWTAANRWILQDLQALPRNEWQFIDYADLVRHPQTALREITKFARLMPDESIERSLAAGLPVSCMTLSASSPDKWRKYEDEINPVLPITQTICSLVEELRWSQS